VLGIIGYLAGSISTALNQRAEGAQIIISTITVTKATTIHATTTLTTATPTTVTEVKTHTWRTTVTRPPDLFETPLGEWLTPDERVEVETKLVVVDGRDYYIRVKVTNISNETLRTVAVLFVPYVGDRAIWNPSSNTKLFTNIEPGETYAHQFKIYSPDARYKVFVFVL